MEKALVHYGKKIDDAEFETRQLARRSLVARIDIPKDTILSKEMLIPLRPALGISPNCIDQVIGKRTTRSIAKYTPLKNEDIVW